MEIPRIRYTRGADGTYIAYTVFGEGPDLPVAWPWLSQLELSWEDPDVGEHELKGVPDRWRLYRVVT